MSTSRKILYVIYTGACERRTASAALPLLLLGYFPGECLHPRSKHTLNISPEVRTLANDLHVLHVTGVTVVDVTSYGYHCEVLLLYLMAK